MRQHNEPDSLDRAQPLYHLALEREWAEAVAQDRDYDRSTFGRGLSEVGFLHASLASQVESTAEAFYRGHDIVLLRIDQALVPSEVRFERTADGGRFPHIYGPLPLRAVTEATAVPMLADGSHDLAGLLAERG